MVRCLLHEKLCLPDDLYTHIGAYIVRNIKKPEGTRQLLHNWSTTITMAMLGEQASRQRLHDKFPEIVIDG